MGSNAGFLLALAMTGGLGVAFLLLMARRRKPARAITGPRASDEPPFIGGHPDAAERYYRQKLARSEEADGPEHPNVVKDLDALARFYRTQNRSTEQEETLRRALAIREDAYGRDHPEVLSDLQSLATLHMGRGDYAGAAAIYRRILAVHERDQASASHSPLELLGCLDRLGACSERLGEADEAERYYRRSLAIREEVSGPDHPFLVVPLAQLARFFQSLRRYDEAEALFRRIMRIVEASGDHRELGAGHAYAALLREMGRKAEAEALERRTQAAQQASFDAEMDRANALARGLNVGLRSEDGNGPT